jgi:hypothetical protein
VAVFDKLVAFQDWVTAAISAAITAALTIYYTKTEVDARILHTVSVPTGSMATGTTTIPIDNTIPQQTEGDQYMTLAITPMSATSKLIIDVTVFGGYSAAVGGASVAALFQDATANALAAGWCGSSTTSLVQNISFRHVMTSGTTSATTFKVRAGQSSAGTWTFNGASGAAFFGGVMASSIVIREVLP